MMSEVCCKRCGAADHVKNGIVRGFQRYHCLSCGCNFTMTPPRGKPPAMKALALLLYAMGNVSFGSIARILGVSDVAGPNWVRDEARKLPEPSTKAEVVVVTLDEMWAFGKKKTEKLWLWRAYDPIARRTIAWVLGRRDDATCKHLLNKIGVEGKILVIDDWEGYHRLIPESQLFIGKDLTVPIEQDNSNIRHFLARFRRRTKVVSKAEEMVDLSLRLYHHLHANLESLIAKISIFRSIFSYDSPRQQI